MADDVRFEVTKACYDGEYGNYFVDDFLVKNFGDEWEQDNLLIYVLAKFKVKCIGLTMAQISKHKPPPNPAKITDPRANKYIEEFGAISWEVDALEPKILDRIIRDSIEEEIDMDKFNNMLTKEEEDKNEIKKIAENLK